MQEMNEDWRAWTIHSLDRGCPPAEIAHILRDCGFATDQIRETMADRFPGPTIRVGGARPVLMAPRLERPVFALPGSGYHWCRIPDDRVRLFVLDGFLSPGTCRRVIAEVGRRMRPSTVTVSNGDPTFRTSSTYDLGRSLVPRMGRAVVWSNLRSDGNPNSDTLHAGLPVEEGTKWVITKWFRDRRRPAEVDGSGDPEG